MEDLQTIDSCHFLLNDRDSTAGDVELLEVTLQQKGLFVHKIFDSNLKKLGPS